MRNSMTQQRRFTKEFEEEAVRLAQTSGRTQREIAGDLGVGLSTLVRWIGRSREGRAVDPAAAESEVMAELKRCVGRTRSFGRSGTFLSPDSPDKIGPAGPKAAETLAKLPIPSFTRR